MFDFDSLSFSGFCLFTSTCKARWLFYCCWLPILIQPHTLSLSLQMNLCYFRCFVVVVVVAGIYWCCVAAQKKLFILSGYSLAVSCYFWYWLHFVCVCRVMWGEGIWILPVSTCWQHSLPWPGQQESERVSKLKKATRIVYVQMLTDRISTRDRQKDVLRTDRVVNGEVYNNNKLYPTLIVDHFTKIFINVL